MAQPEQCADNCADNCEHSVEAGKLCVHDKNYVLPDNNLDSDNVLVPYILEGDYLSVHHAKYDGSCEWKDTCSLKFIKNIDDGKACLVENGKKEQFILKTRFVSSYCFCSQLRSETDFKKIMPHVL